MSKEFVKSVMSEDADNNVPAHADLWPAIHDHVDHVRLTGRAEQIQHQHRPQWLRLSLSWSLSRRPLLLGSILTLLLVLITTGVLVLIAQPATVSAEEVLAKAEQVAKGSATQSQSFYGSYLFRYRSNPTAGFDETRQETWFQAPNQYAYKVTTRSMDGKKSTVSSGADGIYAYNYVSESNQLRLRDAEIFPGDPSTATLQSLLFSPANLADVLERARRKTPPPLNPKSTPRPPYMYDVKLVGDDEVLGRRTYVVEMTLVPGSSLQLPDRQVPERMKMWVDQEVYAVLRMEGWDAQGDVLQSGIYESFQVNSVNRGNQTDIRLFLAPPGADVVDMRLAGAQEIAKAWQEAIKRASYQVFEPASVPDGLVPGRPFYDAEREVVSQVYQGEVLIQVLPSYGTSAEGEFKVVPPKGQPVTRRVTLPRLAVIQGPPASIKEEGLGERTSLQIGKLTGRLYSQEDGTHTLIFDIGGTRIKLYAPPYTMARVSNPGVFTSEQLAMLAETMQPAGKK